MGYRGPVLAVLRYRNARSRDHRATFQTVSPRASVNKLCGHQRYNDLDEFTTYAAGLYRKDYWANSEVNVEVWLEKDALKGVLSPTVVNECGLNLYVTRGFASITYLQETAEEIEDDGRPTYFYVLTDFDPLGVSIAEKVEEELTERGTVLRDHG